MKRNLRIGVIGSGASSQKLTRILAEQGLAVLHAIAPRDIEEQHITARDIDVWLLDLADADWNDALDDLMDRSSVPIFFNEHGAVDKQQHLDYWSRNLIARIYELVNDSDLEPPTAKASETLHIAFPDPKPASSKATPIPRPAPVSVEEHLLDDIAELESLLQQKPSAHVDKELQNLVSDLAPEHKSESSKTQDKAEAAKLRAEKMMRERAEAEQAAKLKAEREIAEQQRAAQAAALEAQREAERLAQVAAEAARVAAEKAEAARREAARLEAERIAREKAEAERLAAEKAEAARREAARLEAERIAREKAEAERLAAEKAEAARREAARLEAERMAREKAEAERIAAEKAEAARREAARLEAERMAREKAEAERIAAEKAEAARREAARLEAERIAREKAEAERIAAEKAEAARREAARLEAERIAREKAEAERIAAEKAEAARQEAIRLEEIRIARAKAEAERIAFERAESARLEAARLEADRKAREKAEAEREATEKAEALRLLAEKAALARLAAERAEAEKLAREQAEREAQLRNVEILHKPRAIERVIDLQAEQDQIEQDAAAIRAEALGDDEIPLLENNESDIDAPLLEAFALEGEFEEIPRQILSCDLWILGASLGGPAALKRFFSALVEPIPVCFVIAQHIDAHFVTVLGKIIEQANSFYHVQVLSRPSLIEAGWTLLVPIEKRLRFLDAGQIVHSGQNWTPPYSPCIDDVLLDAVTAYRHQVHCIIFSGMGEDGVAGASRIRDEGGEVWVQDRDSCASSVMPDAIVQHDLATFQGTPELLAQKLIARYRNPAIAQTRA